MAGDTQDRGRMNFQVPEEMRTMAERSVTQARQALESFLQAARRTTETMEQTTAWCRDQGCGRTDPYPASGSGEADGLRASQLQHAVEPVDGDVHLGRSTLIRMRA